MNDAYLETFGNIHIYPVLSETYHEGNYKIETSKWFDHICVKERCKIIIFHQDFFPYQHLEKSFMAHSILFAPLHYYPLDEPNKRAIKHFEYLIGLCDFGVDLLKSQFPDKKIEKIPLCVDSKMYYRGERDKSFHKTQLGFNKTHFVCAMVANNEEYVDRKVFLQNLKAFALFQKTHKNARLYLHTKTSKVLNLMSLLKKENVKNKYIKTCNQIKYESHGYSRTDVANIYRGCDVLLCASKSEGFGIPIIESQACGCAVITTDFSAMPELTVNGISTKYSKQEPFHDDQNVYWAIPDVDNIVCALKTIYDRTPEESHHYQNAGIEFTQQFSKEILADKLIQLIQQIPSQQLQENKGVDFQEMFQSMNHNQKLPDSFPRELLKL